MTVIGIDLGTRKVAVAVLTGDGLQRATAYAPAEGLSRGYQLLELGRYVHDQALFHDADQVWIEDVIVGNNHKYSLQLAQVLGAVLAALGVSPAGLDVRLVGNKAWKKEIVGNGNASKDMIRNYIVDTHPDYALLCADDQDKYDATCIGLYGLAITDRARDLRLADAPE
jgi:Holliday junction resolvasome RuvABC endonuclease subunit